MTIHEITTELTSITDDITQLWDTDGDRQYCLEQVEDRLSDLITCIRMEQSP